MAWPMVEWVLDTYYQDDFRQSVETEAAILVWDGLEGTMLDLMRQTEADFPGMTVFSLPSFGSETVRRHVELGVRGAPEAVVTAIEVLKTGVTALGTATISRHKKVGLAGRRAARSNRRKKAPTLRSGLKRFLAEPEEETKTVETAQAAKLGCFLGLGAAAPTALTVAVVAAATLASAISATCLAALFMVS